MNIESAQLKENQIAVWVIEIPRFYKEEEYYFSLLSETEQNRAKTFVTDILTSRYVISHGILKVILSRYLSVNPKNISYSYGFYNKPHLTKNSINLEFNLTHSNDLAMIAISLNDQVGVDIEKLDSSILVKKLESIVFSQQEQSKLNSIPIEDRTVAFFAGWTHKEALLKLTGKGLYTDLKGVETTVSTITETRPILLENEWKYLRSFFVTQDYLGAVASTKYDFKLKMEWLDPTIYRM